MNIQHGKLYKNKTFKYLYPLLKYYGQELKIKLNLLSKLAMGIGDTNKTLDYKHLYILVDSSPQFRTYLSEFLEFVRDQSYYVEDYVYSTNQHMIVFTLPTKAEYVIQTFLAGKYSDMYSTKEIDYMFEHIPNMDNKEIIIKRNKELVEIKKVLKKDTSILPEFLKRINMDFGVEADSTKFKNAELDYPPNLEEEIFNYGT
jgi:hypothetical protein